MIKANNVTMFWEQWKLAYRSLQGYEVYHLVGMSPSVKLCREAFFSWVPFVTVNNLVPTSMISLNLG